MRDAPRKAGGRDGPGHGRVPPGKRRLRPPVGDGRRKGGQKPGNPGRPEGLHQDAAGDDGADGGGC